MTEESPTRGYHVELYQDSEDESWVAEVPALPGCMAAGETYAEAMELVGDAIDSWIEAARDVGRSVPDSTAPDPEYSGRFVLRLPASLHAAVAAQAGRDGTSMNTFCVTAIATAVGLAQGLRESAVRAWSGVEYQRFVAIPGQAMDIANMTEFAEITDFARVSSGALQGRAGGQVKVKPLVRRPSVAKNA